MITGLIYKIVCTVTNDTYYGSTIRTLNRRISNHKSQYKAWKEGNNYYITSFQILERGNYSYSLLETVECEDRTKLEARERFYNENNNCVNKVVVGRTNKESVKAYYETNKQIIKEKRKLYRLANTIALKEYDKQQYLKRKHLKQINQ